MGSSAIDLSRECISLSLSMISLSIVSLIFPDCGPIVRSTSSCTTRVRRRKGWASLDTPFDILSLKRFVNFFLLVCSSPHRASNLIRTSHPLLY
jgi:hypothetical protein